MKSDKYDYSDHRLDSNHRKGLYYSYWHPHRTDVALLNFDEHIFHLRTKKVASEGTAVLYRRDGPEMLSLWRWENEGRKWTECRTADDGFQELYSSYTKNDLDCCLGQRHTCIDRERLVTLSTGALLRQPNWYLVRNLPSFITQDGEKSRRLLFTHEQADESDRFRQDLIGQFVKLHTEIVPNGALFPAELFDLKENSHLKFPGTESDFRLNLFPKTGEGAGATAIFVGIRPPHWANKLRDDLVEAWSIQKARRLVIWYEHQGSLKCLPPPKPLIDDHSEHPASYTREERL